MGILGKCEDFVGNWGFCGELGILGAKAGILGEARLQELGLGGSSPVGLIQNLLEWLHLELGMPWWAAIAAVAVAYAELAEYQRRHNVNPLRGFLVPLVQTPLFVSFFLALQGMAAAPVPGFLRGGLGCFQLPKIPQKSLQKCFKNPKKFPKNHLKILKNSWLFS
ncbi:PREDICTED: mitochondrial inner membrane protein OXA1L [Corvus brachyrhynchos]|uniref:mitochondrial inner membrane protein OXA1L n=1 Tax=Corvus brachyrhynchos TaxID=85066 RepID=UPI0008167A1A|nr:PREDICTED: mitochondrial inner membrane protein OXA1L [Corvus brachyrhynchos]